MFIFGCSQIAAALKAQEKPPEKPATVAIAAESQKALLSLQRDFELWQAKLETAQAKIEALQARYALLKRAIQDAAPAGYALDEKTMQYVLKPAEPPKKEPEK